jgi:hypothetical protein
MLQFLDAYGRYRLDSQRSGIDLGELWMRLEPLIELARRDPDGFLADLEALVADDRSGFPKLGAAGLAWEAVASYDGAGASAAALIDAGIAVKQARNLPETEFAGYELTRLHELRNSP